MLCRIALICVVIVRCYYCFHCTVTGNVPTADMELCILQTVHCLFLLLINKLFCNLKDKFITHRISKQVLILLSFKIVYETVCGSHVEVLTVTSIAQNEIRWER